MKEKLIIDTDPAISIPLRDVDDGLAIAMALNSPELEVVGLTLTYGNAGLRSVKRSARRLMKAAGREDVPVLTGARSRRDLGKDTDASRFIEETLNEKPGEVSLLTLGPLTNVARAEKNSPGTLRNARRVVTMGGAVYGPMFGIPIFPAEFNFSKDPPADAIFLDAVEGLVMVPCDLTVRVSFKRKYMKRLREADLELARFIYKNCRSWYAVLSAVLMRDGFPPHDPLAVGWMLRPDLFETKVENLKVVERGLRRGALEHDETGVPVTVTTDVNEEEFLELLVERLTA